MPDDAIELEAATINHLHAPVTALVFGSSGTQMSDLFQHISAKFVHFCALSFSQRTELNQKGSYYTCLRLCDIFSGIHRVVYWNCSRMKINICPMAHKMPNCSYHNSNMTEVKFVGSLSYWAPPIVKYAPVRSNFSKLLKIFISIHGQVNIHVIRFLFMTRHGLVRNHQ